MSDTSEISLPFYGYVFGVLNNALMHTTTDLPPEAWWLPMLVFLILAAAATIDAVTANVPDVIIFMGLVAVTGLQGYYVSWPFAASHLTAAIIAGVTIWAVNKIWLWSFNHDALGMGDAKWTMLAVSCFGIEPALYAWGIGAILAIAWMGVLHLARYKIQRVYFAPFLFFGLLCGIYWLRLRQLY